MLTSTLGRGTYRQCACTGQRGRARSFHSLELEPVSLAPLRQVSKRAEFSEVRFHDGFGRDIDARPRGLEVLKHPPCIESLRLRHSAMHIHDDSSWIRERQP